MIRIVNVRTLRTPEQRATVVYVGRAFAGWRGHPLGNPFKVSQQRSWIATCLEQYRAWLLARPTVEDDLRGLWEECGHGAKGLGCWCVDTTLTAEPTGPLVCHAQVLGYELMRRFGEKEGAK